MWAVNLNAYQTMTAYVTKHVFKINVKTLVQAYAVSMLTVELSIIIRHVLVTMVIQEILCLHVVKSHKLLVRIIYKMLLDSCAICYFFTVQEPRNPCSPSPCGPNSQCREINSHAVCSCSQGYLGMPPNCRPECIISAECTQDKACINNKCVDPCPGTCGSNARCQVINHNPICSCSPGYTGDPFLQCLVERSEPSLKLFHRDTNILSHFRANNRYSNWKPMHSITMWS